MSKFIARNLILAATVTGVLAQAPTVRKKYDVVSIKPNKANDDRFMFRAGPNLTEVARRDYAGWIDAWLADPAKLRPHTTMPWWAMRQARRSRIATIIASDNSWLPKMA